MENCIEVSQTVGGMVVVICIDVLPLYTSKDNIVTNTQIRFTLSFRTIKIVNGLFGNVQMERRDTIPISDRSTRRLYFKSLLQKCVTVVTAGEHNTKLDNMRFV